MGFGKNHELEELSQRLWETYLKKVMEPSSWFSFLNYLLSNHKIEQINKSIVKTCRIISILGRIDNLFIFLIPGECNRSLLYELITDRKFNISKTEDICFLILNPSQSSLNLFLVSFNSYKLTDTIKILRFPQGKIPHLFQELINSEYKAGPLETLRRLFNLSMLEADFLNHIKKKIKVSKTESKQEYIGYLSLLLLCSQFLFINDFLDWLISEVSNFKQTTLKDCIAKIQEFNSQQIIKNDEISKLGAILHDIGLSTFPIDIVMLQNFLQRYPYSLNEPAVFMQEIAITPSFLSEITENLFKSSSENKKEGKYYTSVINTEFISYLAVYRLLSNKLTGITSDDLFKWVYQDWGLVEEESTKISLVQLSNIPSSLSVLDPACGTGAFLLSVIRLLCRLATSRSIPQKGDFPIVEVSGIDLDEIAVLVTHIRLIFFKIHELSKISSRSSIKRKKFSIRWKFQNITQGDFLNHKEFFKEKFDLVLGNPPWVRHEDIGVGQAPKYKNIIQSQIRELTNDTIHFDGKSDLYIYFCLMGLSLLESNGGILAFLTSNAWLEVKYGQTLQKFLLNPDKQIINFDIIHRSKKRLWSQLGINSIILIAEKSSKDHVKLSSGTFTETKVSFNQIPLSSLKRGLISRNEYQDQFYRTEQIPRKLLEKTHKWAGTFLRMSYSERKLIQSIGNKGVRLSHLADIRFGIKTGANDFFHLQRLENQHTDGKVQIKNRIGYKGLIETKYLIPLIKSPSHIKGYIIPSSFQPSLWLFYCSDSPPQESEAWKYIKWGERTRVIIKQGKKSGENILGFSSVRSLKQRDYWYSIGRHPIPSLLWTKSYHDKSGCFYNQARLMPDQRFYGILVKENDYIPLIFTFLNSSLVWALMEAQGNTNMGFGVLDTNVYWLREIKIPVEAMVEKNQIKKLMKYLILEENRVSILKYSKIRTEIDRFYAKYLGLSDNSMKRLYEFISRSIKNRLQ